MDDVLRLVLSNEAWRCCSGSYVLLTLSREVVSDMKYYLTKQLKWQMINSPIFFTQFHICWNVWERFTFTAKPTCPTEWWSVYSRNIGIFRTQLTGRDPKERIKELILDEHVACGCTCPPYLRHVCRGRFNEATCNCDCSDTLHAEDRKLCESSRAGYWDWETCSCRDRSVETRGADNFRSTCLQNNELVPGWLEIRLTGAFLGATLVMTIIFAAATMYYKNKLDQRLDLKTCFAAFLKV